MFGKKGPDGVVESVRYGTDGMVEWVRMYQRRGPTYSDWVLVKRPALIEMLKAGKKVVVGERVRFEASTFKTGPVLQVIERGGKEMLVTGEGRAEKDNLEGVPIV
jgi:glycerate kinase